MTGEVGEPGRSRYMESRRKGDVVVSDEGGEPSGGEEGKGPGLDNCPCSEDGAFASPRSPAQHQQTFRKRHSGK